MWEQSDDPLVEVVKKCGIYEKESMQLTTWKRNITEERLRSWMEKPMHGQYPKQVTNICQTEDAFKWLRQVNLKVETEALLIAAQDQALSTKAHKTYITKVSKDPKCRLCNSRDETVAHLLTGCSKIANTQYLRRHNEVAKLLHWNLCKHFGVNASKKYWMHQPNGVSETQEVKLLWDFDIRTDHYIPAHRPDIVIVEKTEQKKTIMIDVAIPDDRNVISKEREKIEKYEDLRLEVQKLWNTKCEVIPIVVGSLGACSPNLDMYLKKLPGTHARQLLVKAALLGSAHILRRTLNFPESW